MQSRRLVLQQVQRVLSAPSQSRCLQSVVAGSGRESARSYVTVNSNTAAKHPLHRYSHTTRRRLPQLSLGRRNTQRTYTSESISAAELEFGQPVHETHPHLINAGEITPNISAEEYAQRRSRLAAELPENGIAILASADVKYRSGAVFYEFHQEPNFFYLTGFLEPEAVAVIQKVGSGADHIFHLFLRPKDTRAEQWDGARSGEQAALDVFNADESGSIKNLHSLLPPLINGASEVYTDLAKSSGLGLFFRNQDASPNDFQNLLKNSKVKPLKPLVHELRIKKSLNERQLMRKVGGVSGAAFTHQMGFPHEAEKELAASIDFDFKLNGCDTAAYIPVVAGGKNSLKIHYTRNDDLLNSGEMVLVDAGGQYGGYIADITRTWPINGKFTDAQRDLYEAVLRVQTSSVSLCREDANMTLDKIHTITEHGLKDALKQLDFDTSGNAMEILFPHHVGHYIGLDVHDCPGYSRAKPLVHGHCVTVEPGIYVPDDERWPAHFRGMGVRIEDSVCVTETSPLIFTTEAVKEVVDIEALRD